MTQNRNVTTVHLLNVSQSVNVSIRVKDDISPSRRDTLIVIYCFDELPLKIILSVFIVSRQIGAAALIRLQHLFTYIYQKVRRLYDYSA